MPVTRPDAGDAELPAVCEHRSVIGVPARQVGVNLGVDELQFLRVCADPPPAGIPQRRLPDSGQANAVGCDRCGTTTRLRIAATGSRIDQIVPPGTEVGMLDQDYRPPALDAASLIYMYWNERDHPVVHFHAYHAGRRASVSADGEVLAGSLEPRALQFVRERASLRHEEILANWERARRNEPLLGIEPLP
jgi:hypothetical protein